MTRYRDRYEEIYNLLTRADLQRGSEGLDELSLGPELFGADTELWLGFYTDEGLLTALKKYGFMRELEHLGFRNFRLETRTDDPDEHLLRLWSVDPPASEPLIELVVRRDFLRPYSALADRVSDSHIPVLTVEWLMLQNPLADFRPHRPPLPGQRFAGLGVGAQVLELLRNVCHRLHLGGIVTVPSHFHNAVFYSEEFLHFDPTCQGTFLALCRDLIPQTNNSVAAASWALHWEMVRNRKAQDATFPWFQELMVDPINDDLKAYFNHADFRSEVQQALSAHEFEVFNGPLQRALATRGIDPLDQEKIEAWINDV